jgi:AraC-like DNA-binding protein
MFSVLIYPDAIRAFTGMDISLHLDRHSHFCDVFDGHWQEMAHSVLEAMNDGERLRLIENFLVPRWQAVQTSESTSPSQFHDWSHGIARRAADKNRYLGDRQVDRRIKSWTGQALRQLRGIGRAEESLFQARNRIDANDLKWSEVAAKSGYSDQAHMCREFRRITGLSPKDFRKMITHESYWLYQVWSKIPLAD